MANKQRNNVAVLPFETRKLVCRMLLDNCAYAAIDAAVKAECPQAKKLHSTTLKAYAKSEEFRNYRAGREKTENKLIADRFAADALRECAGIETITDMAEMALANQLRDLSDKPESEAAEVLKLVKAVTAIKRTNLANKDEEYKQAIKKLDERYAAKLAEKDAKIAELSATVERLTEARKISPMDTKKVAEEMNKILGVKK